MAAKNLRTQNDFLKKEIAILEEIVAKCQEYLEALLALADAYAELGDYRASLAIDQRIVALFPREPIGYYNLACDYSALNLLEEAYEAIFSAVSVGFRDIASMKKEPDLRNLRKDERYEKFYTQLCALTADTE